MKTKQALTAVALLAVATTGLGFTVSSSKMVWNFLKSPWTTGYDSTGIPKTFDAKNVPANDFLTRVANGLPECASVPTNSPGLIASDLQSNIHLIQDADVSVTFVHEGAGYKNSFGYFTFPDGQKPTVRTAVAETIFLPNVSYYNDGGDTAGLHSGDTVKLGHFTAGTNIGFVVVSNGFNSSTGVATTPVTGGPPGGDWVFYTVSGLNTEANATLRAHTVLLNDTQSKTLVLGIEDMKRDAGADNDFNDIVFTVASAPASAIDPTGVAPLPIPDDKDKDGVKDNQDQFPDDPAKAWEIFVPSATTYGTLVFDDAWPSGGDYDFNDMVVRYRFSRILNSTNMVVEVKALFEVVAAGTGNAMGFGLSFPGVTPSLVASATLASNGATATAATYEAGATNLTYQVMPNVHGAIAGLGGCTTFNTTAGCNSGKGPTVLLDVVFATPQNPSVVGQPTWDPFLFQVAKRGIETHLPGHAPTSLADTSVFKTGDDDSDPATGRYYMSFCSLPWALDVPAGWAWPADGSRIIDAYQDFAAWAQSGGTTHANWYLVDTVPTKLWSSLCTGANAVACTALDQCHDAGLCDVATGLCTNPAKTDGAQCSDGNACTTGDTCKAGACVAGTAVTCAAVDTCHVAGTCDPTSGVCSSPSKVDGTTCSDSNACTVGDTCKAGVCTAGTAVTCTALDPCHDVGTCNTSTGVCSNPAKTNGASCADGNACTLADTCVAGVCVAGSAMTCTALDVCHTAGTCDTGSGICSNPAKANGTSCGTGKTCKSGVCK